MPKAAKHPCPHPGCRALVEYGTRYCPVHLVAADTHKRETARTYDDKRTEARFCHSTRWKRIRDWYIKQHPLCEVCLREGRIVEAHIVDHIKEISDGGARYDEDNLQALCQTCHNRKSAEEKIKRKNKLYFLFGTRRGRVESLAAKETYKAALDELYGEWQAFKGEWKVF